MLFAPSLFVGHTILRKGGWTVLLLACLLISSPTADASAHYWAIFSGVLEIQNIGFHSIFDDGLPNEGSEGLGFRLTVDPTNTNPELHSEILETSTGYGNYEATARTAASLIAVNPFELRTGDALAVFVSATGWAKHTVDSYATSEASVSTKLTVVNETDQRVVVDALWRTCENVDTYAFASEGEFASANIASNLDLGESCWVEPRVFRFEPQSVDTLQVTAMAMGSASAESHAPVVPEPASIFLWGCLLLVASGVQVVTGRPNKKSKGSATVLNSVNRGGNQRGQEPIRHKPAIADTSSGSSSM